MADDEMIDPEDYFAHREEFLAKMPADERALFEQMQADYAERGELTAETQAWIDLRTPNFLVAARAQAQQEFDARLDRREIEQFTDLEVMELAWSRLSVDQQHHALHHDLFGVYSHYTRHIREERDRMDMDRLTGASYLDPEDLDVLVWASVHGLSDEETVGSLLTKVKPEDLERLGKEAWVTVPYDTMWRVLKEMELLRARLAERSKDEA